MFKNKIALLTLVVIIAGGCKSKHATSQQPSKIVEVPEQFVDTPDQFKSELFQKGALVYADDFDGELNKEYLRSKKCILKMVLWLWRRNFKLKKRL